MQPNDYVITRIPEKRIYLRKVSYSTYMLICRVQKFTATMPIFLAATN